MWYYQEKLQEKLLKASVNLVCDQNCTLSNAIIIAKFVMLS